MEKEYLISNADRIQWVLQSLRDDHQLINVRFQGRQLGANSMIVNIDREHGCLSIDEFPNESCHSLALNGVSFDISATLHGVDVSASGLKVEKTQTDDDGLMYVVPMPQKIRYLQRRESFRARVAGLAEVQVDMRCLDGENAEETSDAQGYLADISIEGCRVAIPGPEEAISAVTDEEFELSIHLSEDDVVSIPVICRHSRFLNRSRLRYIGFQFAEIPRDAQVKIDRFVVDMQRLQRQREARLID